jgi:hypothetical protein
MLLSDLGRRICVNLRLTLLLFPALAAAAAVADNRVAAPVSHPPRPIMLPVAAACLLAAAPAAPPPLFTREVTAVLSRAGCNQGACHGNLNGKGGLRLSLRGEDPAYDLATLTRAAGGRRCDPLRPSESLLLRKATGDVPHEGGRRFTTASAEYRILHDWIAAGTPGDPPGTPAVAGLEVTPASQVLVAPADTVRLRATATFTDGKSRDVTGLAVLEPTSPTVAALGGDGTVRRLRDGEVTVVVRYLDRQVTARLAFVPARPGFTWKGPPEADPIDKHVFARLRELRVNPSPVCDDATFLRRAWLDATGTLPPVRDVRAFLADADPKKREKLVDRLLERPEFADFWALKWADLLRNEEKALDRKGVQAFHLWLRDGIAAGKPLDELARDILAARGSTYAAPAANFYRALRDPQARAEAVAQVFLGLRIGCARCHNHPFDRWTQDDYHRFAAAFAPVSYRVVENNRRDMLDKHEFDGEQIVWMDRAATYPHPRTGEPLAPRFLADTTAPGNDPLTALAGWVASPANPFFARTQVNRVWWHLMGRGLVDPIDDFRVTNPASHPALLDELSADFAGHGYDLRRLVRRIMTSTTYQLSSTPNDTNRDDETNYSHARIRPLQAEVLLDGVSQVLGASIKFDGLPDGTRAVRLPGVQQRPRGTIAGEAERFLKAFGKPERLLTCECERGEDTTLVQSFQLVTGPLLQEMLQRPNNRLGKAIDAGRPTAAVIEELYLAALCRRPTAAEVSALASYVGRSAARRTALEDVAWGVLNSKEFLLRR